MRNREGPLRRAFSYLGVLVVAAEDFIELREGDGRFAPILFSPANPTAAGVWRPTPPANAPFFDPWLGFVEPLLLNSTSQFRGPPPAIDSALYVKEFEDHRLAPLSAQTETAIFFADLGIGGLHAGLRDLANRRVLDISDRARLFAVADMGIADTAIAVWDAKCHYGWWRPITAIARPEQTAMTPRRPSRGGRG